jgi:hypothetical protein
MQSTAWAQLLRLFPSEQHNTLILMTSTGTEIAVQAILRIDHEFAALRGRVAGSTEANRLFVVPYAQIIYLGTSKEVQEVEILSLFEGTKFPAPFVAAALTQIPPTEPEPEPEPAPEPAATDRPPSRLLPPAPIKSAVLERFRARNSSPGTTLRSSES